MFGLLLYRYVGSTLKRGGEEGVEDVCVATFHDIAEHKTGGKKKINCEDESTMWPSFFLLFLQR